MDSNRFDTISKLFASRKTRRSAIAGGIGLAATATSLARVVAQDATPAVDPDDPHPGADDVQADPMFLFVQPFDTGAWAPKDGEDGVYTLTLTGAAANTIYFSDRPERIVGLSPTQTFLDGLGFTPENPPNAALVAPREDGEGQEILVIELLNPRYNAQIETLTYDARVLADYGEHGLAHLANQQQDYEIGEAFGAGSLFIDDCETKQLTCLVFPERRIVGLTYTRYCYNEILGRCEPCRDDGEVCGAAFPEECIRRVGGRFENLCRAR